MAAFSFTLFRADAAKTTHLLTSI